MAENPLLPNAELRALYQLLHRATDLESQAAERSTAPRQNKKALAPIRGYGALLAGTLLQVSTGDLVISGTGGSVAAQTLLNGTGTALKGEPIVVQGFEQDTPALLLAAGLAAGLQRSGRDRVVLAFTRSGLPEPQWEEALTWAQSDSLPLILVCMDASGTEAFRQVSEAASGALAWASFQKCASRLKLPVLSVDGQDAVAVYRVMQESVLRARSRGGPAVLWAILPASGRASKLLTPEASPLQRMEHYLQIRNITVPRPGKK